ncbi:LysM peptidoglycan-binding domain-containing protein [Paludibacterium paludis]|uniref:LysM peptidoglycan-binding domain-containing protein n=1 Tax=Paludibacterium paludis TaxID=1225769 RepID=UPI001E3CC4C0|nr:LysM peptidoglycan-binding domain-containing protein [Paludibacterium paludis]
MTCERRYATAVGLAADGGVAEPADGAARETRYEYDGNNRLVRTIVPKQLVGRLDDSSGNYRLDETDLITTRRYDANGNVIQETDARGNSVRRYYDRRGNATLAIDAEGYVTAWRYDGNGKVTEQLRYAARPALPNPDGLSEAEIVARLTPGADDRISRYRYDRLGRVMEETQLNVAQGSVDSKGVLSERIAAVTTRYEYNGLGKVVRKIDGAGGVSDWQYDALGREVRRQEAGFTDFEGQVVRPTTDTEYDGVGNVVRSVRRGKDDNRESDDQITVNRYGAGGRLTSQTDAAGATTEYEYDAAGNVTRTRRARRQADGSRVTDTTSYRYDGANRQVERRDEATGMRFETRYTVYGEVAGKRTSPSGEGVWQEFAEYDTAGRVLKSNSGSGVTKGYVYDENGNATLVMESGGGGIDPADPERLGRDLRGMTLWQMLNDATLRKTVSVYDKRGQHIASKEQKITMARDAVRVEQWTSVKPQTGTAGTVTVGAATANTERPGRLAETGGVSVTAQRPVKVGVAVSGTAKEWFDYIPPYTVSYATTATVDVELPQAILQERDCAGLFVRVKFVGVRGEKTYKIAGGSGGNFLRWENGRFTTKIGIWIGMAKSRLVSEDDQIYGNVRYTVDLYKVAPDNSQSLLTTLANDTWCSLNRGAVLTSGVAGANLLHFTDQPQNASRLILQTRSLNSNTGWHQTEVPRFVTSAGPQSGWFAMDWSGWARGGYEYRYVSVNDAGEVLNAAHGTLQLNDQGPSVTLTGRDYVGGAGRAFVSDDGMVNVSELGAEVRSVRLRRRVPGGAWGGVETLPASPLPGWFRFNPYSAGFGQGAACEYQMELLDGNGLAIGKLLGRLTVGDPNSATSPVAYRDLPQVITIANQPLTAARGVIRYRLAGSNAPFQETALIKQGAGSFYWDATQLPADRLNLSAYEFEYQMFDSAERMVNRASGTLTLGMGGEQVGVSARGEALPSVLSFAPDAPQASTLVLSYRLAGGNGPFQTVRVPRHASGEFRWDAGALMPASGRLDFDYVYELEAAGGDTLKAATGEVMRTAGHFLLGADGTSTEPRLVIVGLVSNAATISRSQRYNAFGEVVQEIDGLGRVTDFAYSTFGKLLRKQDPETVITLENGSQQTLRPVTRYVYDGLGRALAAIDANGHTTTQAYLASGVNGTAPVAQEFHADGGNKTWGYDVFGNRRVSFDELARRTDYFYDQGNRLIRQDHARRSDGRRGYDLYDYDEAGQRIAHLSTTDGTEVLRDTTRFDSLGRVTGTMSAAGRATDYRTVWDSAIAGVGGQVGGGWRTIVTDANGRRRSDDTDSFGRRVGHVDLSGRNFVYRYNWAGKLYEQSGSSGQLIRFGYYQNGYLAQIDDKALNSLTTYEYDAEGNRTFEGYRRSTDTMDQSFQYAEITYDALNRVSEIRDPRFTTRYEYDAVGNRRRVWAYYHNGLNGHVQLQDNWYRYDAMNRFVVSMGRLVNGQIVKGDGEAGVEILYNAAGERIKASYAGSGTQETYGYSADGYLENVWINGQLAASRDNDLLGRTTRYRAFAWNGAGNQTSQVTSSYDADHRLMRQDSDGTITTFTLMNDGTLASSAQVDKGGTTITTTYAYDWWDEAKQTDIKIQGKNDQAPNWAPGFSKLTYDVNGHIATSEDAQRHLQRRYVNNAQGLVLQRQEFSETKDGYTMFKRQAYYYLDGKEVGAIGDDGPSRVDYARALATKVNRHPTYYEWDPIASADFDQNYEPIGPNYPPQSPGSYTLRDGDTLQSIATLLWGDKTMWYLLADANGLSGGETLVAGQVLKVPNKVTNVHNTSATFRVYNPGEAIGDTSPTLPDPPPPPQRSEGGGGCGGIGALFAAVVSVVVGTFTGAWMLAGAIGSIIGQGVSMAVGEQDRFSWRQVALSAIGSGVSAAIGGGVQAGAWEKVGRGMLSNAVTQGVAVMTGLQKKFDWTGVAGAGLGAGVASQINLGSIESSSGGRIVAGTLRGVVSGGVQSVVSGHTPNWGAIAVESFGCSLGNTLVESQVRNLRLERSGYEQFREGESTYSINALLRAGYPKNAEFITSPVDDNGNPLQIGMPINLGEMKVYGSAIPYSPHNSLSYSDGNGTPIMVTRDAVYYADGVEVFSDDSSAMFERRLNLDLVLDDGHWDRVKQRVSYLNDKDSQFFGWLTNSNNSITNAERYELELLKRIDMANSVSRFEKGFFDAATTMAKSLDALGEDSLNRAFSGMAGALNIKGNDAPSARSPLVQSIEQRGWGKTAMSVGESIIHSVVDVPRILWRGSAEEQGALTFGVASTALAAPVRMARMASLTRAGLVEAETASAIRASVPSRPAGLFLNEVSTTWRGHENSVVEQLRSTIGEDFASKVYLRVETAGGKTYSIIPDGLERSGNSFIVHDAKFSQVRDLVSATPEQLRSTFTINQKPAFDAIAAGEAKVMLLNSQGGRALLGDEFRVGMPIQVQPSINLYVNSPVGVIKRTWP